VKGLLHGEDHALLDVIEHSLTAGGFAAMHVGVQGDRWRLSQYERPDEFWTPRGPETVP